MTERLFDPALVQSRLARAARQGPETFLIARVAEDLADRLAVVSRRFPVAVDLGTPTGHVVEALRPAVAAGLIGQPLRLATSGAADIGAVPEALPLAPASVDLVVSALAFSTIDDLPGTFAQIRRALRPDGLFLAGFLGGETLTELRRAFAETEAAVTGGISPRVAPFVDVREAGALLQRAGFALPVTDMDRITVRYPDAFRLMADLRRMGATNPLKARLRKPTPRAVFLRLAEAYAERFADPDGRIRATFDVVWVSGWAPHESQQKPLKPGSAAARLADALGTTEQSTGEKPG